MTDTTRRAFLANGAILTGSVFAGLSLGNRLVLPAAARADAVIFPETSCGADTTGQQPKILIAYASYCGSTGGVAEAVAQTFCQKGAAVDVRLAKEIGDISPYQAVVVGSAVRSSSWWPEAVEFVTRHEQSLSRLPVAYFLTCLALYKETPAARKTAMGYFNPALQAAPKVKPVDFGCFAGVLDYGKMNFIYRRIMKSKMTKRGVPEGDFRDWPAIKAWAEGLESKLGWQQTARFGIKAS